MRYDGSPQAMEMSSMQNSAEELMRTKQEKPTRRERKAWMRTYLCFRFQYKLSFKFFRGKWRRRVLWFQVLTITSKIHIALNQESRSKEAGERWKSPQASPRQQVADDIKKDSIPTVNTGWHVMNFFLHRLCYSSGMHTEIHQAASCSEY